MLVELTVRNLAVIEHTRLVLGKGLNVVTGETGAGKSLLVDALQFVLGGSADRTLIRAGEESASVEAVFEVDPRAPTLAGALSETGVELDEPAVVLFRETHREGRTVSRLNGRAVPASVVRTVGGALVDIYGQGTTLSLLNPAYQLLMLDGLVADDSLPARVADAVGEVRRLEEELADLAQDNRLAEQQKDLLNFQVNEIADAGLRAGEEAELARERDELANAEMIREACSLAYEALYGESANATDLVGQAVLALRRSADPNGTLAAQIAALEEAGARLSEAARDVRDYAEAVSGDPERLQEIEDRLDVIKRLKRKYGDTVEAVLAFADEAQRKLDAIVNVDDRREELAERIEEARERAGAVAWELSLARRTAAARLAEGVAQHLADVGMGRVRFGAEVGQAEAKGGLPCPDGKCYAFSEDGIDRVDFLVETNLGEGLKPLSKIASGGETSRLMLALISALHSDAGVPTLVFDEIDSGIGGRASDVIGRKLWALGRSAQVMCVTHLPQIAAYADHHYRVEKAVAEDRTFAGAHALEGSARVDELAEMLGGARNADIDGAARRMLEAAEAVKASR